MGPSDSQPWDLLPFSKLPRPALPQGLGDLDSGPDCHLQACDTSANTPPLWYGFLVCEMEVPKVLLHPRWLFPGLTPRQAKATTQAPLWFRVRPCPRGGSLRSPAHSCHNSTREMTMRSQGWRWWAWLPDAGGPLPSSTSPSPGQLLPQNP